MPSSNDYSKQRMLEIEGVIMPKGTNQKLKLFYLLKIMLEKTDEDHRLTVNEILAELEKYDVTAERKQFIKIWKR